MIASPFSDSLTGSKVTEVSTGKELFFVGLLLTLWDDAPLALTVSVFSLL